MSDTATSSKSDLLLIRLNLEVNISRQEQVIRITGNGNNVIRYGLIASMADTFMTGCNTDIMDPTTN